MKEKKFRLLVLPAFFDMKHVLEKFSFDIELTKGKFNQLEIIFSGGKMRILHEGVDLKKFSFVWLCSSWADRDLAYAVRLYLNQNNIPNTYVEKGTSKLTDQLILSSIGVACPNTLFIDYRCVEKYLDRIRAVCGYPLIIKDTKGSRGKHSMKISSEKELLERIKDLPKHKKYFFQQYIPNEYNWGIMVANGKISSGEKSYPQEGEFRNNICNGAREVFFDSKEIPLPVKKMAINAGKALNLIWSRSDIIIDKNSQKPYMLEVNRMPGITPKTIEAKGACQFIFNQISLVAQGGGVK